MVKPVLYGGVFQMFLCVSDVNKSLVLLMMTKVSESSRPLYFVLTVTGPQLC